MTGPRGVTVARVSAAGRGITIVGAPVEDRLIYGAEAARIVGVKANTWRGYVRDGLAPPADHPGDLDEHPKRRRPRWLVSTVEHFRDHRLGQGTRTDLIRSDRNDNQEAS